MRARLDHDRRGGVTEHVDADLVYLRHLERGDPPELGRRLATALEAAGSSSTLWINWHVADEVGERREVSWTSSRSLPIECIS
jgi:hypothetical protein